MIKSEWKGLWKNKMLILVMLVIALIPAIYAGLFLASMWDPYGSVENLPVAVVNEDEAVKYKDKTLKVGKGLVDKLKKNDSLAFNFVDAETATDGLKNGTYYMVITIPENFSGNAATLMDKNPKKMELQYATNPGTNYIASKLSESALAKIKTSITKEVTKTYTETVFDQISTVGDGMQAAADGAGDLKDGMDSASNGNEKITKNLKKLASSTLTFSDGASTLSTGISDYTDGVSQVNNGAKKLNNGVSTLTGKLPTLTGGITTLNKGVGDYTNGVATLNKNSSTLSSGSSQVASGATSLASGAKDLQSGAIEYINGAKNLADGTKSYVAGAQQLSEGAQKLSGLERLGDVYSGISKLNTAVTKGTDSTASLKVGTGKLEKGLKDLDDQLTAMTAGTASVVNASNLSIQSADSLSNMSDEMNTALDRYDKVVSNALDDGSEKVNNANEQIDAGNDKIQSAMEQLENLKNSDDVSADDLNTVIQSLEEAKSSMSGVDSLDTDKYREEANQASGEISNVITSNEENVAKTKNELNTAAATLSDSGASKQASQLSALKTAVDQLYAGAQVVNGGVGIVSDGLTELETTTEKFPEAADGVKSLNDGFAKLTENNEKLTNGATQLVDSSSTLENGFKSVVSGAGSLATGSDSLNTGVKSYTSGVSKLNSKNKKLTTGTKKLVDGADTLASGANELSGGTKTLYKGTSKLVGNNAKITSGASKLADGSVQIQDGSKQLYQGSKTLGDGLLKLNNGSDTLQSSLAKGTSQVKNNKASDDTIDMFAAPVNDKETKITKVENNGHAMAPYMMSVGLWVGSLAFCLMYPLTKYKGELEGGVKWWAGKATVLYPLAILQGILVVGLLHVVDGFTPVEMAKTFAFAILASMAFASMQYFFNVALGKAGSFLMLVFMVVQLAGSAGTYPIQLSPKFVSAIHAFVPFTYSVDAFRSTICGGESIMTSVIVMMILILIFSGLTIGIFEFRAQRINEDKPVLMTFLEEKGLV